MSDWIEVPVFVHGITPDRDPDYHNGEYDTLLGLIIDEMKEDPFVEPIYIEWGWAQSSGTDKRLAEAERKVALKALDIERDTRDYGWHFLSRRYLFHRVREAFLYGFADMFYYVSEDGKTAVRKGVFKKIIDEMLKRGKGRNNLSFTFFTHSAGTIIIHDLLYHIFGKQPRNLRASLQKNINTVKKMKDANELRIRRFYTIGSPITPMSFRAESIMKIILNDKKIDPRELGLVGPTAELGNPRWVNFWDKDDVISYPLAFLYDNVSHGKVVEDHYVDIGDVFPSVHSKYWSSRKVAEYIAKTF